MVSVAAPASGDVAPNEHRLAALADDGVSKRQAPGDALKALPSSGRERLAVEAVQFQLAEPEHIVAVRVIVERRACIVGPKHVMERLLHEPLVGMAHDEGRFAAAITATLGAEGVCNVRPGQGNVRGGADGEWDCANCLFNARRHSNTGSPASAAPPPPRPPIQPVVVSRFARPFLFSFPFFPFFWIYLVRCSPFTIPVTPGYAWP